MTWKIRPTKTFSQNLRKHAKNQAFLTALDKKVQRLREAPHAVGGHLSGKLHGFKSTRIVGKFRLLFRISEDEHAVYLEALDHRKSDYERFNLG